MKFDPHPPPDRPPTFSEQEFWKRLKAIRVIDPNKEYAYVVDAYRKLEEEFIHVAHNDEFDVLGMKRAMAQRLMIAAYGHEQPFDVCRDNWHTLVELGFSSFEDWSSMVKFYADCCWFNAQEDAGLAVVDMVIAEIHRRLDEPGLTRQAEQFYDQELASLGKRHEKLIAYRSSEAVGIAWDERNEAEIDSKRTHEPNPRERRESQLRCDLSLPMSRVRETSSDRSFAEMVSAYREVEADFLAELGNDDQFFIPEVRRQVAAAILEEAHKHHESFDVCHEAWNELQQWDFKELTDKCALTRTYAQCCLLNGHPDVGLSVIIPLLMEIQKHVDEGTDTEMPRLRYPREIARLTTLRDELTALKIKTP